MFFRAFRKRRNKRRAIAAYVTNLPRLLLRDYGASPAYTPAQIKRTLERSNFSTEWDCYALSMFADPTQFDAWNQATGENCVFGDMRAEIAAVHFQGAADFAFSDFFDPGASPQDGAMDHAHHGVTNP